MTFLMLIIALQIILFILGGPVLSLSRVWELLISDNTLYKFSKAVIVCLYLISFDTSSFRVQLIQTLRPKSYL